MLGCIIGTAEFEAKGSRLYDFINSLREHKTVCMSQRFNGEFFCGKVYSYDIKKLKRLADDYGVALEITKKSGLSFKIKRYRFRYGIVLGVLIFLASVFYISNFVITIEVRGNSGIGRERIISALEESGIYKGKFISGIDFHSCEQKLRLSIPEIAWTGIKHTGGRIVVDITEIVSKPQMLKDDIPCNIISDKDAEIIYIEVYSGKKLKKEGSGVKKGDIIISGIIDDSGGHNMKVHAKGKIIGRYKESITFTQPLSDDGKVYGREIQKRYLSFFGMRLPLFIKKADCSLYEYTETENRFSFFGTKLPIGVISSTYAPFEYKTLSYSTREAMTLLEQQISRYEKNFFDLKNITVENREKNIKNMSDSIECTVTYTMTGEIGLDHEIYVR